MDYKYEEESDATLNEYFEAIKRKPKTSTDSDGESQFLKFFNLEVGQKANFRIVKVMGQDTFYKGKQHCMIGISVPGIVIPPKVKFVSCTEGKVCLGEDICSYLNEKKSHLEFKTPENLALFKMMKSAEAKDTLYMVGIDRRDNTLKVFQPNSKVAEEILSKAKHKKFGSPSHPENGYDWVFERINKNDWKSEMSEDATPLKPEEKEMIAKTKFTWDQIKSKATVEHQKKLGIKFENSDSHPALSTVNGVQKVEEPTPVEDSSKDEDDIPF